MIGGNVLHFIEGIKAVGNYLDGDWLVRVALVDGKKDYMNCH
jgi:hypothetical protein